MRQGVIASRMRIRNWRWLAMTWLAVASAGEVSAREANWLKLKTAEFTLVTTLREKEALVWANEFSMFVHALQSFIPVNKQKLPALTIVVFADDRDFADYRPIGGDGRAQEVAGFFSRRETWAVAGLSDTGFSTDRKTTFFHEGTHWFLSAFEHPNPVWMEEGLAEVFSTFAVGKKNITWGRAIPEHVQVLNAIGLMPVENLVFMPRAALFTGDFEGEVRTGITYAQSWAIVHYLVFGQRDLPGTVLTDYARLSQTAMHPDEVFQKAFGVPYAEMDKRLERYVKSGRYYVGKMDLPELPPPDVAPAKTADVEFALAQLALAAGRRPSALAHAQAGVTADSDQPRGYELLGRVHLENENLYAAVEALAAAVERGSRDHTTHYDLAMTRQRLVADGKRAMSDLAEDELRRIASGFEGALAINDRHLPSYQGMARLADLLPAKDKEWLRQLAGAQRMYPKDGWIKLGLAVIAKRIGREADARELVKYVLDPANTFSADERRLAQTLDGRWNAGDLRTRIDTLREEKNYAEALKLVEQELAETADVGRRRQLAQMRRSLQASLSLEEAKDAMSRRDWAEARLKLTEIIESDASPLIKKQAERRLEEVKRREGGSAKKS